MQLLVSYSVLFILCSISDFRNGCELYGEHSANLAPASQPF